MIPRACPVPGDALLHRYVQRAGCYTDCFEVMHPMEADLPAFVAAFYTTWLFRLERMVLALPLRRWVRDGEVAALAEGSETFAAWRVEDRTGGQILLCDLGGHTRSWLAVAPKDGGSTRLLFGSAVVPPEGKPLSGSVRALIPLHRFYSRALLRCAEWRLRRGPGVLG
jgi:hypothetical protein